MNINAYKTLCSSKIHRATITQANLNYIGSITIDKTLILAANLSVFEQVHVVNITNGNRFVTYVIEGEPDSGIICVNGAASRLVQPQDLIIVLAYAQVHMLDLEQFQPKIVFVDCFNKVKAIKMNEAANMLYEQV